jgi:energy-coupling factor transporter ATP-binding protein EcfA2
MDFYMISQRETKEGLEIFPSFLVKRNQDLMVRGRDFYAVWDEANGLWSTNSYRLAELIDDELRAYSQTVTYEGKKVVKYLQNSDNGRWAKFRNYVKDLDDSFVQLDSRLTFLDDEVKKSDYVSKRLPYTLAEGDISAWDEIVGTLYDVDNRAKLEWAIGSIVAGDSQTLQKFVVLYGPAGTGKSTILKVVEKLFEGYIATFDAKSLGSANNTFATESFRSNPLVAIQHDGDLSRIEDNTMLNSIISHEDMEMKVKFKSSFTARVNAFLFMGTNQPVKISDSKSGIIRRLIDVHPTGAKLAPNHYFALMSQIDFELGAIAYHCYQRYLEMGKNYYSSYRPTQMMFETDMFFNFVESHIDIFKNDDGTTLKAAYALYKEFCEDAGIAPNKQLPMHRVREELKAYFHAFDREARVDGTHVRNWYSEFDMTKFKFKETVEETNTISLVMEEETSLLDEFLADQPAQYANKDEFPEKKWDNATTTLKDLDTSKLHYTKVPENFIVIDFDLKDNDGHKSAERNLEAASSWPATYGEFSKGGGGVHLHYLYDGDASLLRRDHSNGIEVKVYTGNASLRRRLTKCNNVPIATLPAGALPIKETKVLKSDQIQSEKGLRELILRNLRKEIHSGTKPSVDFIAKILEDAYVSGLTYDVSDLRPTIIAFANNSTNQSLQALKVVQKMKWKSDENSQTETTFVSEDGKIRVTEAKDDRLVFFDVEVYPNLFVVCWKYQGSPDVVRMINPSSKDIENLFVYKLVGFNNRRYDNHILWAAFMGYNNEQLYKLSQAIIEGKPGVLFGEAYNLSYADIYDFASVKKSLKKWMIELKVSKMEMSIPWDQPVPDDMIDKVVEYCCNDVEGTEATFEDRKSDFTARQILAELSGLTANDTTQKHTAKILFGNDRNAQEKFVYTDLSEEFPGYTFDMGQSSYMGEDPSEGGYVYSEPGMYENVAVLDVASMHPTSIIQLNLFGDEYTPKFKDLLDARIAIKRGEFDKAREMLDGRLAPYLQDESTAKDLSYALKIVINIVYGLTSAKFDNPFRDHRNKDNIVAKRGALFMIKLKNYVQTELGVDVVHIKTDSIKVANPTDEVIKAITDFGAQYGYEFEHEATYDKFCLVNDAVYIARKGDEWDAVGAQFQHPYVYKTLFTNEPLEFDDFCETKQVAKGAIYMDFEHDRPAVLTEAMQFVGKIGRFVPVIPEQGGAVLYRVVDDKHYAVAGTKGYYWVEAEMAKNLDEDVIDLAYFEGLAEEAKDTINKWGSFEEFVS